MYKENLIHHLKSADELVAKKEFESAKKIYNGILAEVPGQPDSYYGLYKIALLQGDIKSAEMYFREGLLKLSISKDYDDLHREIFDRWIAEYKQRFNKELFFKIVDKKVVPCQNSIKALIAQKKPTLALKKIRECELNKELLLTWFNLAKDFGKIEEAVEVGFNLLQVVDDTDVWFEIMRTFTKNRSYYDAIKVALKIANKDERNHKAYYHIAALAYYLEYNYEGIVHYLMKAIELKSDYKEAIALLVHTFVDISYMTSAEKAFKEHAKTDELKANLIDVVFSLDLYNDDSFDIYKIKEVVYSQKNLFKLSELFNLALYTGKKELCDEILQKMKSVAELDTEIPKIKDKWLKKKSKELENVVAFHTIGRGGSFFFHSLIDGHKEVASYPGVYLKGYFEPGTFGMTKSSDVQEHIKRFMNVFDAMFDASSAKRVPGDPMGGNIDVGEKSGLTALGEERDIVFKVDKKRFFDLMLKYLKNYKVITQKEFFKIIHLSIEEIRGADLDKKKLIFYHIHNAPAVGEYRYANLFEHPRDLIMIRNWLQSLESWMYSIVAGQEKRSEDEYSMKLNRFRLSYVKMYNQLVVRLFNLRAIFYISKDMAAVKLEDVKNTPEATMRAVAKWMGIEYDESLLRAEFMGLKFHSNKSKLNPTISEFDKKSIERKVGVLFSHKDAVLLNTVLRPWNETFEYDEGEFKYVSVEEALKMNENIMDWEQKLIDFFEIKEEDALKSIKYRKQKLALALKTQEQVYEELKKVRLIKTID